MNKTQRVANGLQRMIDSRNDKVPAFNLQVLREAIELLTAPAPAAEQKPVRYELRMCADGKCDEWKPVSKERYDTLTANGGDTGDGLKFEGRALYAAPVAAAAPGAVPALKTWASCSVCYGSATDVAGNPCPFPACKPKR